MVEAFRFLLAKSGCLPLRIDNIWAPPLHNKKNRSMTWELCCCGLGNLTDTILLQIYINGWFLLTVVYWLRTTILWSMSGDILLINHSDLVLDIKHVYANPHYQSPNWPSSAELKKKPLYLCSMDLFNKPF